MTDAATGAASTPLYKYVDIAVLKRILQGSVRFTQPSAFNDPFELLPEVVVPSDAGAKKPKQPKSEKKTAVPLTLLAPERDLTRAQKGRELPRR
jgi:hypothetical protein